MIVVLFAVLSLVGIVMRAVTPDRPRPVPTTQRTTPAPTLPVKWTVTATQLRPDLTKPELLSSTDGLFDDSRAIDAGTAWLVLTGDANDTGVWVHGLDPSTGRELWKRDLPDGLCAAGLVGKAVLCASAIEHDDATGLGTSWHLARLDPATGRELSGTDWTGWLTLVHADRDRVLLVEQRQPAPHAVLTVLNADLEQRAQFDLRAEPQHAGLFSDNRIVNRKLPIPDGPALDRPRIRKVADGLTALWVGQSTAFVDLAKGTLIGVPRCSRLVDDGTRLWCNQGAVAAALGYSLKPLFETDLNTRLAFPNRDPRAGDVTDPVFLQQTGLAVRVNPSTGRTIGPLVNTRNGSAFGTTTSPQTAYLRGVTLVWDSSTLFAVKARTGELLWQLKDPGTVGDPWNWKGRILLAHRNLRILDPASGRVVSAYRQGRGLYTEVLGDALIAVGPDELALLVDP